MLVCVGVKQKCNTFGDSDRVDNGNPLAADCRIDADRQHIAKRQVTECWYFSYIHIYT